MKDYDTMRDDEALGRGLGLNLRANATTPEARRLVFQEDLFGRALAAFDAGRRLARSCRNADIYLDVRTGAQAAPLNAVAAAIDVYGPKTWPLAAKSRVVERLAQVERDLVGNWEGLYKLRMEKMNDTEGELMLTPASVQAFNRFVSPEDVTFYLDGNEGVTAPLRALMRLPPGPERHAVVERLRKAELAHVLFRRMATRMCDGGGLGLQTMGSSQFFPVGETLNDLYEYVPELRSTFFDRRYTMRLPEEVERLPARWSIADWTRANSDGNAPFWTYDGQHKGAHIRAFQALAKKLPPPSEAPP
jgi:hypothetical protein